MTNLPGRRDALFDEIHRLVVAYSNGELTPDGCAHFNRLLAESKTARQLYVEYVYESLELPLLLDIEAEKEEIAPFGEVCLDDVDGQVGRSNVAGSNAPTQNIGNAVPPLLFDGMLSSHGLESRLATWPVAYLIAAVVCGIGVLIGAFTHVSNPVHVVQGVIDERHPNPEVSDSTSPNAAKTVGRITGMIDCRWAEASRSKVQGSRLGQSRNPEIPKSLVSLGDTFNLVSGLLEITYETGAKVILQGPVNYRVDAENSGFLAIGRLTGQVDTTRAKGFAVHTPTATVIDLGTEFGVEVNDSGATYARVFRGRVDVKPDGEQFVSEAETIQLTENESVLVASGKSSRKTTVRRDPTDSVDFVRFGDLPKLNEQSRLRPFRRWQEYSGKLRDDPSLLAYYDFQQRQGRPDVLTNVAAKDDRSLDGSIEQAVWTEGRMPGKHALYFQRPDDFVQINLPRTVEEMTLAAWVNVASLHDDTFQGYPVFNGLLMSDNWSEPGQLHWQFGPDGCAILGRFPREGREGALWQSSAVFDHSRLRRWTHVAVAIDQSDHVKFYVNGQLTDDVAASGGQHTPICIGSARIGVWNQEPRTFNGRVDELAIWGRTLEQDEIRQMCEAGRPDGGAE